jgi:hypothetical protein
MSRGEATTRRLPPGVTMVCPACGSGKRRDEELAVRNGNYPRFIDELVRIGDTITASASFVIIWLELHQELQAALKQERGPRRRRNAG